MNYSTLHIKKVKWEWTKASRAAICVGFPFLIGFMQNNIMDGMWVAMGSLMMVTGEGSGSYQQMYRNIFISGFLGSLGYFAGYLTTLPWSWVVISMFFLGMLAAILSSKDHSISIGMLQVLLLASIAIGVPSIEQFWQPTLLYLLGVLFYSFVLSLEFVIRKYLFMGRNIKEIRGCLLTKQANRPNFLLKKTSSLEPILIGFYSRQ